jgi:hypothetical protein
MMEQPGFLNFLRARVNLGALLLQLKPRLAALKAHQLWGWGLAIVLSGLASFYGTLNPKKYEAPVLIAIEDDESGGWTMMLEQFGIDVGGTNPGGIFKGEALVKLFTTRGQVERTLLHEVELGDGSREVLANRYLASSPYRKMSVFRDVRFTTDRTNFTSTQDSLLKLLYTDIVENVLQVSKPETKLSLIEVRVRHSDPYFAQSYAEESVINTKNFYIETVSIKAKRNFEVLQREADSVRRALADNMTRAAVLSDVNINPSRQILRLDQNRNNIEMQINASLYSEIIKSLKRAEVGLRKETPLIQTVDTPEFPLDRVGLDWWQYGILGFGLGLLIYVGYFLILPTE